jgi:hypothetical protein
VNKLPFLRFVNPYKNDIHLFLAGSSIRCNGNTIRPFSRTRHLPHSNDPHHQFNPRVHRRQEELKDEMDNGGYDLCHGGLLSICLRVLVEGCINLLYRIGRTTTSHTNRRSQPIKTVASYPVDPAILLAEGGAEDSLQKNREPDSVSMPHRHPQKLVYSFLLHPRLLRLDSEITNEWQ